MRQRWSWRSGSDRVRPVTLVCIFNAAGTYIYIAVGRDMCVLTTAQEMRDLDRYAIETIGIPGVVLMENAGKAVARLLRERFPRPVPPSSHRNRQQWRRRFCHRPVTWLLPVGGCYCLSRRTGGEDNSGDANFLRGLPADGNPQ